MNKDFSSLVGWNPVAVMAWTLISYCVVLEKSLPISETYYKKKV